MNTSEIRELVAIQKQEIIDLSLKLKQQVGSYHRSTHLKDIFLQAVRRTYGQLKSKIERIKDDEVKDIYCIEVGSIFDDPIGFRNLMNESVIAANGILKN